MREGEGREERAARRGGGGKKGEESAAQFSRLSFYGTGRRRKFKKESREKPPFARFD